MRDNYDGHAGVKRREPKVTQQDYLVLRRLSNLMKESVEKYLAEQDGTILDLGCGNKPYQPYFFGKSATYVGADTSSGELADILCSGEKLPFDDSSFSAIVCAQVLEHVEDPRALVDEAFRVLKPDGLLLLSTHGNWPVHGSPDDYWRWTEQGLRKLLADFEIHEICKCGGSAASMVQLLELFVPEKSLGKMIILLLNKLGDLVDSFSWLNANLPDLATNYLIEARKKKRKVSC